MRSRSRKENSSANKQRSLDREHFKPKRQRKRSNANCCWSCLRTCVTVLIILYGACLFAVKFSRTVQDAVIYLHWINIPFFCNLSNPSEFYGLEKARSFRLPIPSGGHIGVWQILSNDPNHPVSGSTDRQFEEALSNGQPVILYMHGNLGSRGSYHRVRLYQTLASLGNHIISLDYQGYGDSTGWPTETGMADDARIVWEWTKKRVGKRGPMYVWGHSLGSAGATLLCSHLCNTGFPPSGLILEAPITNIVDASMGHPFSYPFRFLPFFREYIIETLPEKFNSIGRIGTLTCPMLILHGARDSVVPIEQGKRLYEEGVRMGQPIKFREFPDARHKTIKDDPQAKFVIKEFFDATSGRHQK